MQIDPKADKIFLGWVVAASPIGQLISSPLLGWLANRWNSVRWLCVSANLMNAIGHIVYGSILFFPGPQKYWMIVSRFIIGISAGST